MTNKSFFKTAIFHQWMYLSDDEIKQESENYGLDINQCIEYRDNVIERCNDLNMNFDKLKLIKSKFLPFDLSNMAYCQMYSKTFKIDDEIFNLLWNTDTEIDNLHLPFPSIFIDYDIKLDENISIKGIFMWDKLNKGNLEVENDYWLKYLKNNSESEDELKKDGNEIYFVLFDNSNGEYVLYKICYSKDDWGHKFLKSELVNAPKDQFTKYILDNSFRKRIVMFSVAFLKFLYNPEVEICYKEYSPIRIKRKAEQGKIVENHNYLKLTGKIREYINLFDNEKFTQEYQRKTFCWIVRGYYRILKNERFKNKKGNEIYIPPYVKGIGRPKQKEYLVSDKKRIWYNEFKMKEVIRSIFPNHLVLENTRGFLDGLEIDCYIPDLKIGFEYNGKQHYEFVNIFHRDEKDLKNQIKRDKEKNKIAKKRGIKLITIKYNEEITEKLIKDKIQ